MISLLGSLLGFGSSLIGPVLETWNKSSDQKLELAMLHAQAEVPAGLVLDHFLPPNSINPVRNITRRKFENQSAMPNVQSVMRLPRIAAAWRSRNPVLSPRRG